MGDFEYSLTLCSTSPTQFEILSLVKSISGLAEFWRFFLQLLHTRHPAENTKKQATLRKFFILSFSLNFSFAL